MNKEKLQEMFLKMAFEETKSNSSETLTEYEIGKPYTLMTVLGWYKGILVSETDKTLTLTNASWVAESGRFSEYVKDDSNVKEEEPFEEHTKLIVERSSLIAGFKIPGITRKLK